MRLLLLTSVLILFNLTQIYSQLKDSCCQNYSVNSYIKEGEFTAGITAGYSFKSKVPAFGINLDHYIHQLRPGIISVGVTGKFNSATEEIQSSSSEIKTRNISAGINFKLSFNRLGINYIVPFTGILMGYNNSLTEYEVDKNLREYFPDTHKHSFNISWIAGLYCFFSKNFALSINFSTGNIEKGVFEGGLSINF